MTDDYAATGAQRDIPPFKAGIPYSEWIVKVPVATRAEIEAWRKSQAAAVSAVPAPKSSKKVHSGSLPGNTEWL